MQGVDGGYRLSELLSIRGGSADEVVDVTAIEFRFGAVLLTKKINVR